MARLRRSDATAPGITRRRRGRGFQYVAPEGPVEDAETLGRIATLAIPPAWTDVWVCLDPNGHLQATGTDAAGRRQYLYHERWRARRDQEKFDRMLAFARELPRVRRQVDARLSERALSRDRVLAGALRLLDLGLFRVGNDEYANGSGGYGLATLAPRHVRLEQGSRLRFDYRGKTGRRHVLDIVDPDAHRLARELERRAARRRRFLVYENGSGWSEVRATDINQFLKDLVGLECSAKDFRTWHATVLAAVALANRAETARGSRTRAISSTVREVADQLGNTPAVCRSSYIDPRLLDRFREGVTIAATVQRINPRRTAPRNVQARIERAVVDLLSD